MNLKRFFELLHDKWPIYGAPVTTGNHAITMAQSGQLVVSIYLPHDARWITFRFEESELEDPEKLIDSLESLMPGNERVN